MHNLGYTIGGIWLVIAALIMIVAVWSEERSRPLCIGVTVFGVLFGLFALSMLLAGLGVLPVN